MTICGVDYMHHMLCSVLCSLPTDLLYEYNSNEYECKSGIPLGMSTNLLHLVFCLTFKHDFSVNSNDQVLCTKVCPLNRVKS